MGIVKFDISMSLDGFIAGPNDGPELGLGEGGEALHEWIYDLVSWREPHQLEGGHGGPDSDLVAEASENIGAAVMGRKMFDNAIDAWGEEPPFHGPVFVLTHRGQDPVERIGTTFTFVTEGPERAMELAKEAAGDQDVAISGGADVAQQYLRLGMVDTAQVHIVPILLGGGRRMFEKLDGVGLEQDRVVEGDGVTHIRYRAGLSG